MAQFFVTTIETNNTVIIEGEDYHHIVHVQRKKIGDAIQIIDMHGTRYKATIASIEPKRVVATITQTLHYPELNITCTLCIAILKGKKFDLVIQKAVEIGVAEIVPMVTERTIPDITEKEDKKRARWQKIANEAAKQCLRKDIPTIYPVTMFGDVIKREKEIGIMAHADPVAESMRQFLKNHTPSKSVMLMIGPEGGFSKKEVEIARQYGWFVLYNGATQLRAETAAIVLPAILIYEWGFA